LTTVKKYLSLVKFSHTIFAMPFAFIGFFLAIPQVTAAGGCIIMPGTMSGILSPILLQKFGLVLVCMVTARNAAMAFNRYLDRHFDALNPRTAIREIPAGILSAESALRFVIGNSIVFVLLLGSLIRFVFISLLWLCLWCCFIVIPSASRLYVIWF
jgi:4-hydroxybenzoate polyprenyltransferase